MQLPRKEKEKERAGKVKKTTRDAAADRLKTVQNFPSICINLPHSQSCSQAWSDGSSNVVMKLKAELVWSRIDIVLKHLQHTSKCIHNVQIPLVQNQLKPMLFAFAASFEQKFNVEALPRMRSVLAFCK
eukprot:1166232-Amphidinium_carterae.1